jgi:hypothetical protein
MPSCLITDMKCIYNRHSIDVEGFQIVMPIHSLLLSQFNKKLQPKLKF